MPHPLLVLITCTQDCWLHRCPVFLMPKEKWSYETGFSLNFITYLYILETYKAFPLLNYPKNKKSQALKIILAPKCHKKRFLYYKNLTFSVWNLSFIYQRMNLCKTFIFKDFGFLFVIMCLYILRVGGIMCVRLSVSCELFILAQESAEVLWSSS